MLQSNSVKNEWYWFNGRQVDQWNRIEDPEMNQHSYVHLIFDKGAQTIQWKKRQLLQQMVLVLLVNSMQKNANRSILMSLYSSQVQVDKDLHIKPDTLKLLEKELGKRLEHMGTGEILLNRTQISYVLI